MGDEVYEGYERISRVLDYFTTPDLLKWKMKVGAKEAKRARTVAMKIGTNVDEWIKADVANTKLPKLISDEAKNCVDGYILWKKEYNPKLTVGTRIFDDSIMVTGEPDLLTDLAVIDIKCSTVIRPAYWLQTEFYAKNTFKTQKAILRLDKHLGVYQFEVMSLKPSHWAAVTGLVQAYRFFTQSLTEGIEEQVNDDESSVTDSKAGSKEDLE